MELIKPSIKYKDSFLRGLEEYQKEDGDDSNQYSNLNLQELQSNFTPYIEKLLAEELGVGLPEGFVPQSTYWLIDNREFIGTVSIRYKLTQPLLMEGGHIGYDIRPSKRKQGYGKKILELVLPKVKALGIAKALVTCDETNIASKKIIEANGGVFENRLEIAKDKPAKLRYWITL